MSSLSIAISFLIYFFSAAFSVLFIKGAEKRKSRVLAAIGVLIPTIVATFREAGVDFYAYEGIYNHVHAGGEYPMELGWITLNRIAPSYKALLFMAALIFFGVSYRAIRKFDEKYRWLSWLVILSVSTGMFYNVTRQAIASAFVFLGIACFSKKKYIRFAVCVALGALFHKTAIIMLLLLPLYWFVMKRVKKLMFVTLIMSGVALLCVPIVVAVVSRLGLFPSYVSMMNGFNLSVMFLFYTIPPLFYYALKPKLFKEDKHFRFCLALYLFVIPMQFLGMRIPYADRIMLYFRPMLAIVVPLMVARYDELGKGKNAKRFYVLWFIFYHIIMGVLLNENAMYPYMNFNF